MAAWGTTGRLSKFNCRDGTPCESMSKASCLGRWGNTLKPVSCRRRRLPYHGLAGNQLAMDREVSRSPATFVERQGHSSSVPRSRSHFVTE